MWWLSLTILQRIFFCIACPASVFLVVQIILMLIGLGGDGDLDADGVDLTGDGNADITVDTDSGLSLFTVKSLTAFFSVGAWVGFTLGDGNIALCIIAAVLAGSLALVLMALILRWLIKLQSSGNLEISDSIGKTAEVYLTIPKKGDGEGKITIILNERLTELSAIQDGAEPIKTGSKVKVISIIGTTLIVEKLDK